MSSSRTRTPAFRGRRATSELALALTLAVSALSCVRATAPNDLAIGKSERPDGASAPVAFSFESLDARPVNSGSVAGKPTVLAFVTTWDLSSQAQIDFLVPMSKTDGAQVNYVMVALQEPKDRELVEVFAHGLKVTFLGALADKEILDGGGPFGAIRAVPTMVILDRASRMVWRHVGLARPEEIREGLSGL